MAETVLYEKRDNIVVMTLNRPDALNSINRQLRGELADAITEFDSDPTAFVCHHHRRGSRLLRRTRPEGARRGQRRGSAGPRFPQHESRPSLYVAADLEAHDCRGQRVRSGRRLVHRPDVRPAPGLRGRQAGHHRDQVEPAAPLRHHPTQDDSPCLRFWNLSSPPLPSPPSAPTT